jgi:undecaprenyl diphosphate synthase
MNKQAGIPRHVAIVMDGNGRWASKRFLPRIAGHRQGVEALKRIVSVCGARGVQVLTVFAFSSENWNRPADEVSGLMSILANALAKEVQKLKSDGVCLKFIGSREYLSDQLKQALHQAEQTTEECQRLTLNVCFNYGGRWDIAQAAARLAADGKEITESSLAGYLALSHCPDPDLLIRTGGEFRLSNFLLWQAAYSELYFSPLLWPDFDETALDAAIQEYASRERRFGLTSEQIARDASVPNS